MVMPYAEPCTPGAFRSCAITASCASRNLGTSVPALSVATACRMGQHKDELGLAMRGTYGLDDGCGSDLGWEFVDCDEVAREVGGGDRLNLFGEAAVLLRGPLEVLRLEAVLEDCRLGGYS